MSVTVRLGGREFPPESVAANWRSFVREVALTVASSQNPLQLTMEDLIGAHFLRDAIESAGEQLMKTVADIGAGDEILRDVTEPTREGWASSPGDSKVSKPQLMVVVR